MGENQDTYKSWRVSLDGLRLSLQHFIWREFLGYNLNPLIQLVEGKDPIYVADVAAGHCLWSIQVAQQFGPTCQVEASDVSLNLCPPDAVLPPNVRVRRWNFFDPVPQEWIGKFDVVHVRLIVPVFPDRKDPSPVLERLVTMLKPGGWLQWDEYEYDPSRDMVRPIADPALFPDPMVSHPAAMILERNIYEGFGWDFDFFTNLADRFRSVGLEDVAEDQQQQTNMSVVRSFFEYWLAGFATQMADIFEKTDPERSREQRKLIHRVRLDQEEDGIICYPVPRVVVGRKKRVTGSQSPAI